MPQVGSSVRAIVLSSISSKEEEKDEVPLICCVRSSEVAVPTEPPASGCGFVFPSPSKAIFKSIVSATSSRASLFISEVASMLVVPLSSKLAIIVYVSPPKLGNLPGSVSGLNLLGLSLRNLPSQMDPYPESLLSRALLASTLALLAGAQTLLEGSNLENLLGWVPLASPWTLAGLCPKNLLLLLLLLLLEIIQGVP